MIDQLKYTKNNFMKQIQAWMIILEPLYLCRSRNINQAKLTDVMVLALLCWQVELNMTVQTKFYYFILNEVFNKNESPERLRFNRICNQDGIMLKIIRYHLVHDKVKPQYTIIDSLPIPLCAPIRNFRATLLNNYANIDFNSTKQLHYYGFKGNFKVSNQGIIVAYTITKASIHDIKSVKTLFNEYPCKRILADQDYLSKPLKQHLAKLGIWFWTPRRSNMTLYRYNNQLLRGFNTRLEQCLLVDTIEKLTSTVR